jgi:hypothetical protein
MAIVGNYLALNGLEKIIASHPNGTPFAIP